jgi:hypothetical protein
MGAAIALSALGLWLAGSGTACVVVLAALVVPTTLEAVFGYCVGCRVFALVMRACLIPASVCAECGDIWSGRVGVPSQRGLAVD